MVLSNGITIVVQSTDQFSDCWPPFFTLLKAYWPDCRYPIVLNTETKIYAHEGLDIRPSAVGVKAPWPTWSESLLRCLDGLSTDLVLFLLDDYFLDAPVSGEAVEWCAARIRAGGYSSITLTEHGRNRGSGPGPEPRLLSIRQDAKYRLSTSPALWRTEALRRYLRPAENAWQFEKFGSWRARRTPDSLLLLDPESLGNEGRGAIPYFQAVDDTGIVKGRWQKGVDALFRSHGIAIDYSLRGFHEPLPSVLNKYHLLRKLTANPVRVIVGWLPPGNK